MSLVLDEALEVLRQGNTDITVYDDSTGTYIPAVGLEVRLHPQDVDILLLTLGVSGLTISMTAPDGQPAMAVMLLDLYSSTQNPDDLHLADSSGMVLYGACDWRGNPTKIDIKPTIDMIDPQPDETLMVLMRVTQPAAERLKAMAERNAR